MEESGGINGEARRGLQRENLQPRAPGWFGKGDFEAGMGEIF